MCAALNKEQSAAVHYGKGPLLVLAGPGSGKTLVITRRIQILISKYHIDPSHIAVLTFTRAAAKEMQKRFFKLSQNMPSESITTPFFGTFHSFFYKILKEYYPKQKPEVENITPLCSELFAKNQAVCRKLREKYRYFLIDEFQDIDPEQYEIIRLLAAPDNHLFLVGDDDQSIYGFRGAAPSVMKQVQNDYSGLAVICLGTNYRSTEPIVRAAAAVIGENHNRFSKELSAIRDGERIRLLGFPSKDQEMLFWTKLLKEEACLKAALEKAGEKSAVLFRTNRQLEAFSKELNRKNIPFCRKTLQKSIYQSEICADLQAYLHFSKGERSRENFYRFMNKPFRGFGREAFLEEIILPDALPVALEEELKQIAGMKPYGAVQYIRKKLLYDNWLLEAGEMETGDRLQESMRGFRTLEEWERNIREEEAAGEEWEIKGAGVFLSTIHGVKGLEFERVYIPMVNEGYIPSGKNPGEAAVEEERRLFYVGMTRAKERLWIGYEEKTASRFLEPLLPK